MRAASPATIPVTVVGGFLGAGKTTFLNHLLKTSSSRYAVLVNDFGAVNIDAGLIAKHDGTTLTLTNGCVCCSTGGGFIDTLNALLDSRIPFDHIVIEASGVGDPWRIAEIALVEPSLRLNAVIVIADASRIEHLLIDPRVSDTVRKQFERCDVVLLNKTDICGSRGGFQALVLSAHRQLRSRAPRGGIAEPAGTTDPSQRMVRLRRRGRYLSSSDGRAVMVADTGRAG